MEKQIRTLALKRWNGHNKTSICLGKTPPKKEDFVRLLQECYNVGFKCCYCKKQLLFSDSFPYKDVASIDHKIPLTMNGNNNYNNLVVCCHMCNIVKGTMRSETYQRVISELSSETFDMLCNESFKGKFANKIERLEEEKLDD